jgi:hypothetical protein
MNRKTIIALVVFVGLLGLVYFLNTRPDKGERRGERPRPLPKIEAAQIKQVSITAKGTTVVLARDGGSWRLTQPVAYPADKYASDTMIEKIAKLETGDLVTEQRSRHSEYEVDDKGVRVIVSDGSKALVDFRLGKVVDDFTMLRLEGKDQVFQAVGSLRFLFDRETKNWRNRSIIDFKQAEARQIEVTTAAGAITLARPDEKTPWKVEKSSEAIDRLDDATISNLISTLYSLSAFDFADGATADKTGLDKPVATVAVTLKDGKQLVLLIGKHKDDDYWVQRKGAPQIFVVKKYTIENLQRRPIDFRDKTMLSFKAGDVTAMTYELNKDKVKSTVKLTLKGSDWHADGKKVADASKIKSAVDGFATLKAEGFASHTDEELGMDPPLWTVEIVLKDRTKHQITIGSVEKDTIYGVKRKGVRETVTLRKHVVDRLFLDPKTFK